MFSISHNSRANSLVLLSSTHSNKIFSIRKYEPSKQELTFSRIFWNSARLSLFIEARTDGIFLKSAGYMFNFLNVLNISYCSIIVSSWPQFLRK